MMDVFHVPQDLEIAHKLLPSLFQSIVKLFEKFKKHPNI